LSHDDNAKQECKQKQIWREKRGTKRGANKIGKLVKWGRGKREANGE
jgi:hypothetical protein